MSSSAPETVVVDRPAGAQTPRRTGLRREIGFIGLLWASAGSIIGSGWLFGAQKALIAAGPAAIISWCIGALAIFLLALTHAELGGMWPVAGGTARFPHYAFGGGAGASFGWFSWLQAATVAPIEVLAIHRRERAAIPRGLTAPHGRWCGAACAAPSPARSR